MSLRPILTLVLGELQETVKNPKSVAKEIKILKQIRDAINQIISGIEE